MSKPADQNNEPEWNRKVARWSVAVAGIVLFVMIPTFFVQSRKPEPSSRTFSYPAKAVSSFSGGRFTRPANPMWRSPISFFVAGDKDPRGAFMVGMAYTAAQYVGVEFSRNDRKNFVVYLDRSFHADLKSKGAAYFQAGGVDAAVSAYLYKTLMQSKECGGVPVTSVEGDLMYVVAFNYYEFGSDDFLRCSAAIVLSGLGAYIFVEEVNKDSFREALSYLRNRYANYRDGAPFGFRID